MSYTVERTNKFKRSLKKCQKRGLNMELLKDIIRQLSETGTVPPKYRPHKLSGQFAGNWECHIQSDWLLIWDQDDTTLTLLLIDTGNHADLFG